VTPVEFPGFAKIGESDPVPLKTNVFPYAGSSALFSDAVIYTHPAVREVAVFGLPDPKWGEIVKAVVVLTPGKTLTAEELIAYCRRSLANFKVPRSIETATPVSYDIMGRASRETQSAEAQHVLASLLPAIRQSLQAPALAAGPTERPVFYSFFEATPATVEDSNTTVVWHRPNRPSYSPARTAI